MRILDNYIIKSIVSIFITTVLIFCFLYILIDITGTLDEIIDRKVPINVLIQYYLTFLPLMLVQTSSIACLIATLFTYGSLNNNNEIIAMRSSGLNFWIITKPAIFFSLIISVLIFFVNEQVIPKALETKTKIQNEHMVLKVDRLLKKKETVKNLTFYGLDNHLYFIDSFNPVTYELNGITISHYDKDQNILEKIVALKGTWIDNAWTFNQCQITTYGDKGINDPVKIKVYQEKVMELKEQPDDFLKQRLNVDSMNIKQLVSFISKFSDSGAMRALNNRRVELHKKIASPFGNFVIVLIGLPFALMLQSRKRSTFASLGIAILIGFLYHVADAVTLAFGKGGLIAPIAAAWLAPILFSGIAVVIIEKNF